MSASRISAGPLLQAMKQLNIAWEQTHASWRDQKSQEFAQQYLSELPYRISQAAEVIQELDEVMKKIRRECE